MISALKEDFPHTLPNFDIHTVANDLFQTMRNTDKNNA